MSNTEGDGAQHGARASHCRECGTELGAGYLCDDCDTVEGWP